MTFCKWEIINILTQRHKKIQIYKLACFQAPVFQENSKKMKKGRCVRYVEHNINKSTRDFSFRKRKMINILIEHHKKSKYTHVVLKIKDYSFFYFYYILGGSMFRHYGRKAMGQFILFFADLWKNHRRSIKSKLVFRKSSSWEI